MFLLFTRLIRFSLIRLAVQSKNNNRWKVWIDRQKAQLNGAPVKAIDFYAIEEPWTKQTNPYSSQAEGDVIEVAKEVYAKITE